MTSPIVILAGLGLVFFMLVMMYSLLLQHRAVEAQGRGMTGIVNSVAMQRESFEMQRQSFEMQKELLDLARESLKLHQIANELLTELGAARGQAR